MTTVPQLTGRAAVRAQLSAFLINPPIANLNQVMPSFPKFINYEVNSMPGQMTRAAGVIYIADEYETRLAIGGATNGWKRVDYTVIIQIFSLSFHRNSIDVMNDFDIIVDNIKERLRSDHNFGDPTGNLVWQGAEPVIQARYGEPSTEKEGVTEIFAEIQFPVTQMIQA
jgi:hypothetical protein